MYVFRMILRAGPVVTAILGAVVQVGCVDATRHSACLAQVEPRLKTSFRQGTDSFQFERAFKRLEVARRLEDRQFDSVPTRSDELAMFRDYFEEEIVRWNSYPLNPSVCPRRLNVRDFGAKGDGVSDDAPAFEKALAAAKEKPGVPTVVEIPEGVFFLRTVRKGGNGLKAHALLDGCTNLVLTGASPERTCLLFDDLESPGVVVEKSCNVCVRNVDVRWKTTPFTQGRIESYDIDKGELVIRLQEGTLRPDDPYYRRVDYPQLCCSAHREDGSIVLGGLAFWDLRCKDLGDGRFKLFLVTKNAKYRKAEFPIGAHAVIPARRKGVDACRICETSRFCAFESVWVRNAPAAAFIAFGDFSTGYGCRVLPRCPELKLSSNADGFFNSCGSHVSHCEFRGMNDDGANSHTKGKHLLSQLDEHTLTYRPIFRSAAPGEPMQVFHAQSGELLATLHVVSNSCGLTAGKLTCTTRFREEIPAGIRTESSAGVRTLTAAERYAITRQGGKAKSVQMADVIFQPLGHGIGYVVCDNVFHHFRGIGVNVQSPNALIEGNRFENINNGVEVSALMNWLEGVPPHNVVIRGNLFKDVRRGISARFLTASGAVGQCDPFMGVSVVSNRFEGVAAPLAVGDFCKEVEAFGNDLSANGRHVAAERSVTMFVALTGKPTVADVERKLDELKSAGLDSFMVYPTSGLRLEYLGDEFFRIVRAFAAGAERRSMKMWLYDEYNWPSGSCRGRVPAENDRFRLTQASVHATPGGGFEWKKTLAEPGWVNLLEPDAVRRFIEMTHLEYERHLGRWMMNGTVRGIFTDEPGHPGPLSLPPDPLVSFRCYDGIEADYRALTGRDFRGDVEAWIADPKKGTVWRDYAKICGNRFRSSYYDQIRRVTDRQGIVLTGHMIYDDRTWKCVLRNGDPLKVATGPTLPGIDEIYSCDRPSSIPFNLYAIADYATRKSGCGGMCELFSLGPADMPPDRIRRMIWLCALHGVTRYFAVMSWMDASWMEKMRGFTTAVGEYQPWFREFRTILDEADRASAYAAKTPIRDVAVRYPQDLLADAAFDPAHREPEYARLLSEIELEGLTPMLVASDELTDLPIVLSFDGSGLFDERTKRRFPSVESAVAFVSSAHPDLPRRRNVLMRRYTDGTRAELDLNPPDRSLPKGVDVRADWKVTLDGSRCMRVPFGTNRAVRVSIPEGMKGVRLVARVHRPLPAEEEDSRIVGGPMCEGDLSALPPPYQFALDGRAIETPNETKALPPSYNQLYRESIPVDLSAGTHEFRVLSGRDDVSYYLPSLFVVGGCADSLQGFAGKISYAADLVVPEGATGLAVDSGNVMTKVSVDGVDLGTRGWVPFAWELPERFRGRSVKLEISVFTSVLPIFGDPLPGQDVCAGKFERTDINSDPGLKGCRFVMKGN